MAECPRDRSSSVGSGCSAGFDNAPADPDRPGSSLYQYQIVFLRESSLMDQTAPGSSGYVSENTALDPGALGLTGAVLSTGAAQDRVWEDWEDESIDLVGTEAVGSPLVTDTSVMDQHHGRTESQFVVDTSHLDLGAQSTPPLTSTPTRPHGLRARMFSRDVSGLEDFDDDHEVFLDFENLSARYICP